MPTYIHKHELVQDQPDSITSLFQKTGDYIETRVELLRLKAVDTSSEVASSLATNIVLLLVLFLVVSMVNIGVSLWLGELLGRAFYGFFIVAGFYAIVGLLLFIFRKKWIKTPISRLIIQKIIK